MPRITNVEHVEEFFRFSKHELEDDFFGTRQIQINDLIRSLTEFVRRMADEHTLTAEEQNLVEMEIATSLLASFQIRARGAMMRQIILDRSKT